MAAYDHSPFRPTDTDYRFFTHREALPAVRPDVQYIVVDVAYFSTTLLQLFEQGIAAVYPATSPDHVHRLADTHDALAGIEPEDTTPGLDSDFVNRPTSVPDIDAPTQEAVLTSANGCAAVHQLGVNHDIAIGAFWNARAIAKYAAQDPHDRPVWIVCAGSDGSPTPEDTMAGHLIAAWYRYYTTPYLDRPDTIRGLLGPLTYSARVRLRNACATAPTPLSQLCSLAGPVSRSLDAVLPGFQPPPAGAYPEPAADWVWAHQCGQTSTVPVLRDGQFIAQTPD